MNRKLNGGVRRRVEALMIKDPTLSDNPNKLIVAIWEEDLKKLNHSNVIKALESGELTDPEYIKRNWRFIQEKRPQLRGEKWHKRQQIGRQIAIEINE